jgi:hypothetical protein
MAHGNGTAPDLRLTSREMARFVRDGLLRFDGLVARDLCAEAAAEIVSGSHQAARGQGAAPFRDVWSDRESALGRVFRLPRVAAIIHSLVGPDPRYDHHAAHLTPARTRKGANLHQDAEYDVRRVHFDIQISFFPEDTPAESGGTLFLPGSQFRRVYESTTSRYQDVLGQVQAVCDAGTMFFWHTNVWHAARSNHTDRDRYMFKLRLNPTVRQQRLWNTGDLDDPETRSDVGTILSEKIPWHGQRHRIEVMNRIRLWRYLTGDPDFDLALWWSRIENTPQTIYRTQRV